MDTTPSHTEFDLAGFKRIYQQFDQAKLADLMQLYSSDVFFKDPVHELKGKDALTNYFATFFGPDVKCQFAFIHELVSGDQAFFHWEMHYSHPRLDNGKRLKLDGASLIRFTSQITHHQDFYDMGAMIYQHIPILGWSIKKINARIAGSHS